MKKITTPAKYKTCTTSITTMRFDVRVHKEMTAWELTERMIQQRKYMHPDDRSEKAHTT
jgi:hypothetical protein